MLSLIWLWQPCLNGHEWELLHTMPAVMISVLLALHAHLAVVCIRLVSVQPPLGEYLTSSHNLNFTLKRWCLQKQYYLRVVPCIFVVFCYSLMADMHYVTVVLFLPLPVTHSTATLMCIGVVYSQMKEQISSDYVGNRSVNFNYSDLNEWWSKTQRDCGDEFRQ